MALTPDKVRNEQGLRICEKIIPWGAVWNKNYSSYKKGNQYKADRKLSNGTGNVGGVTVHNTDGGANAETYTRATYPNQNMRDCRVHYYVDDREAWQNLREDEVGWHAGDGKGNGNETTISIEIIMQGKAIANNAKSESNGALLAALLLHRHSLGIDKLYTHNHWMGHPDSIVYGASKNCPIYILPHWAEFKAKVQGYLNQLDGGNAQPAPTPTPPTEDGAKLYRVQLGAFHAKANADALAAELKSKGYSPIVVAENNEPEAPTPEPPAITAGARVRIKAGATKYATGQSIPAWVKAQTYTAAQVEPTKVLLKEITSWVNKNDIEKI